MNNSQFTRNIMWLILASFILWTSGCTSMTVVRDLGSCKGKEITVHTRDGRTFLLTAWTVDTSHNIIGKGAQVLPSNRYGTEYKTFSGTLLAYDIANVQDDEVDWGTTAIVIPLFALIGWGIGLVAKNHNHLFL